MIERIKMKDRQNSNTISIPCYVNEISERVSSELRTNTVYVYIKQEQQAHEHAWAQVLPKRVETPKF